jgi:hypothetical protein
LRESSNGFEVNQVSAVIPRLDRGIQETHTKKENHNMKILGVLINLGVVAFLGYQAATCLGPEQVAGLNIMLHPGILSFVGIVALFIVVRY